MWSISIYLLPLCNLLPLLFWTSTTSSTIFVTFFIIIIIILCPTWQQALLLNIRWRFYFHYLAMLLFIMHFCFIYRKKRSGTWIVKKRDSCIPNSSWFSWLWVSVTISKWNIDERCHLLIIIYIWIKYDFITKITCCFSRLDSGSIRANG